MNMNVVAAHTKVNGFCKSRCQDLYVCSLVLGFRTGLPETVPTISDASFFAAPPWQQAPGFIQRNYLAHERSRAWIFKHSFPPTSYILMASSYRWVLCRYYRVVVNGVVFVVKKLRLRYEMNDFDVDANGDYSAPIHDQKARRCRGWSLFVYTNRADQVHCLLYKRRHVQEVAGVPGFLRRVRIERGEHDNEERNYRRQIACFNPFAHASCSAAPAAPSCGLMGQANNNNYYNNAAISLSVNKGKLKRSRDTASASSAGDLGGPYNKEYAIARICGEFLRQPSDLVMHEVMGGLKNVYAIGAGMVAALTNESATSKLVYFAHCTSEMMFISHLLAGEAEKLAGPLLADSYVTLLKGRNAWYGQMLAEGEIDRDMGDSISGKGMIQGVSAVGAFYKLLSQSSGSSLSIVHAEEKKPVAPVESCPILKTLYKILITREQSTQAILQALRDETLNDGKGSCC